MAIKIRLTRNGAKKHAHYRVVVTDSRSPRDGKFLELIGTYDPAQNPPTIQVKKDRYEYWVGKGAKPTITISRLLKRTPPAA